MILAGRVETDEDDVASSYSVSVNNSTLIEELLAEIKLLKEKIAFLESKSSSSVQQVVFQNDAQSLMHYADWVSNYIEGKGHFGNAIRAEQSVSVNALNAPNSHKNIDNSLALGRGGQVILGFSEPVTDRLVVF